MIGYDVRVIDFALNLFLTTKSALHAQCLAMFNNCSNAWFEY